MPSRLGSLTAINGQRPLWRKPPYASLAQMDNRLGSAASQFFHWQDPRSLWNFVRQSETDISDEDLMNRAGDEFQKLKEAIVASMFAVGFGR